MATWPANGSLAWDDALFTWVSVAHESDGTLKSGALPAFPAGATFYLSTNNTTISIYNSVGALITTGTDLGAIFNARVASRQTWVFGPGDYPISTTLSVPDETYIGIRLVGAGGLSNMNIQNVTLEKGVTYFKYTPSTGTLLDVAKAQGISCEEIHFHANHASYAGALLDFSGDYTTSPRKVTRHVRLKNCTLQTRKGDTTKPLLELNTVVDFVAEGCLLEGGRWNVRGFTDATAVGDLQPTDEIHFYGCRFQYYQGAYGAVANAGRSWSFNGCTFERAADASVGVALVNDVDVPGESVSFNDTYFQDFGNADSLNQAFFTWNGTGLAIRNFYISQPSGQRMIYCNDDASGIYVSGVFYNVGPDSGTEQIAVASTKIVKDITWECNEALVNSAGFVTGNLATPPRTGLIPYRALTADTTLTHGDHQRTFGISASGGARVITLPLASCAGLTITIKKTDSSSNAVTLARTSNNTFEGSTSLSLTAQWKYYTLVADGTATWNIVGTNV